MAARVLTSIDGTALEPHVEALVDLVTNATNATNDNIRYQAATVLDALPASLPKSLS